MKDIVKYGSAVVVYVALTLVTKKHLNWIAGPLFLVVIFDVIPRMARRVRGARGGAAPQRSSELA